MNTTTDCDRVRVQLMASLDGEAGPPSESDRQHVAECQSCREWLQQLEAVTARLTALAYPSPAVDLWTAVEARVHHVDQKGVVERLLPIAALVVAWRALQLFVDVPLPMLHPLVTLAAVIAAVWQMAGDPLAIETFAPELEKRGI